MGTKLEEEEGEGAGMVCTEAWRQERGRRRTQRACKEKLRTPSGDRAGVKTDERRGSLGLGRLLAPVQAPEE